MNILMMTNTYTPHVGGVARSVEAFTTECRKRGNRVMVIAPVFENLPETEVDVVRLPAIQHFSGSDFSVVLPIPRFLEAILKDFKPDIVHSHHPFLVGSTAVRIAHVHELPLVFTHHTLYEKYTHYVPGDSQAMKRFAIQLSTDYANLCDQVIAPSESVAELIRGRGVETQIDVIPTGVEIERYRHGDRTKFRASMGIPDDAFVIGHVGRLAPEKNLEFLAHSLATFIQEKSHAHVIIAGAGPSEQTIRDIFNRTNTSDRLHITGILKGDELVNVYHAMDIFAFASTSETQGMVLTEAMAAAIPVVALDASGVREVVVDYHNGRLLRENKIDSFVSALDWLASLDQKEMNKLKQEARNTANTFSIRNTADKVLLLYEKIRMKKFVQRQEKYDLWHNTLRLIEAEWNIFHNVIKATGAALHLNKEEDR